MLPLIVIIILVSLLIFMFVRGYRKSKRELAEKERVFREELITLIQEQNGSLSDEIMNNITLLPVKQLTTYLQDNVLTNHTSYNQLLKKHFELL